MSLETALAATAGSNVQVGAQTMHYAAEGAFTGETAPGMLVELGVPYVILGHSERRQYYNENDADLARKVRAALDAGMRPDRSAAARRWKSARAARPRARWADSSTPASPRSPPAELAAVAIAYEPIWAIGTGVTATPEQAQETVRVRAVARCASASATPPTACASCTAAASRPPTSTTLMAQPDIDGVLVGGASLDPQEFAASSASRSPRDPPAGAGGATYRPVVLIVMDGWGVAPPGPDNAVSLADTPVFDRLLAEYPHGVLDASGPAVGLPPGQMGNSEVGHLNIGAGRVVYQDLTRIDLAIEDGSFFENRVLSTGRATRPRARGSRLHLMGLVSDGGVHSRHGPPRGAASSWRAREKVAATSSCTPSWTAATRRRGAPRATSPTHRGGDGRASARARYGVDQRPLLRHGPRHALGPRQAAPTTRSSTPQGFFAADAQSAVDAAYARGENDEFVRPTVVAPEHDSRVRDGDVCLFFNFRPDRARELTRAFTEPGFDGVRPRPAPAAPSTSSA